MVLLLLPLLLMVVLVVVARDDDEGEAADGGVGGEDASVMLPEEDDDVDSDDDDGEEDVEVDEGVEGVGVVVKCFIGLKASGSGPSSTGFIDLQCLFNDASHSYGRCTLALAATDEARSRSLFRSRSSIPYAESLRSRASISMSLRVV